MQGSKLARNSHGSRDSRLNLTLTKNRDRHVTPPNQWTPRSGARNPAPNRKIRFQNPIAGTFSQFSLFYLILFLEYKDANSSTNSGSGTVKFTHMPKAEQFEPDMSEVESGVASMAKQPEILELVEQGPIPFNIQVAKTIESASSQIVSIFHLKWVIKWVILILTDD